MVIVPAHFDAEILSAVRRMTFARVIDRRRAKAALDLAARLRFERVPLQPLLRDAFELRERCSTRDALYVSLARRRRPTPLTSDAALARACRGIAAVELVAP